MLRTGSAAFGQKGSRQLYNEKKAQYSSCYPPKSWTEASFTDDFGKRVTDCAGLIKWFLWSDNMNNKNPTYKSSEDWGSNTFWNKCTSKGSIGSLPSEKVGILVFRGTAEKKTHVGVIVDNNGTVVEAKGHAYGTVKSKASDWGYWGKCNLITYESTPEPTPTPTPTPTSNKYKVSVNTYLSLRNGTNTSCTELGRLYNGAIVTITEQSSGWGRVSDNLWCSMKYLKQI